MSSMTISLSALNATCVHSEKTKYHNLPHGTTL